MRPKNLTKRAIPAKDGLGADRAKYGVIFGLLIIYYFFEYVRPQTAYAYLNFVGMLKIPMFLSIMQLVLILKSDKSIFKDKLVILVVLFLAEIAISVTYARNTYYVFKTFNGMSLLVIAMLATVFVLDTQDKFRVFARYWVYINLLLAMYIIKHGGMGPGGFLRDENDVALAMAMVIPISVALFYSSGSTKIMKFIFLFAALTFIAAIISSMSRGGFLGLASLPVALWLFSKRKLKILGLFLLLASLLSYPVYKLVPEDYRKEISTITDKSDSTRNTRMEFWGLAWDMYLDNPITGVGARNFPWNVAHYQLERPTTDSRSKLLGGREAHSLYFTLFAELGSLGATLYILILYTVAKRLLFIVKLGQENEKFRDFGIIATALVVSLAAFLVSGTFISVLYYPPLWYLVGFTLALHTIVHRQLGSQRASGMSGKKPMPQWRRQRTTT